MNRRCVGVGDLDGGLENSVGNFSIIGEVGFHLGNKSIIISFPLSLKGFGHLDVLEGGARRVKWQVSTMVILGSEKGEKLEWDANERWCT